MGPHSTMRLRTMRASHQVRGWRQWHVGRRAIVIKGASDANQRAPNYQRGTEQHDATLIPSWRLSFHSVGTVAIGTPFLLQSETDIFVCFPIMFVLMEIGTWLSNFGPQKNCYVCNCDLDYVLENPSLCFNLIYKNLYSPLFCYSSILLWSLHYQIVWILQTFNGHAIIEPWTCFGVVESFGKLRLRLS